MDPKLIYVKTVAGEEAIRQRTRVIQRNVRMVLILVDGQSSVLDLSRKTGNTQLTENALAELEKGGFIAFRAEPPGSLWAEGKRVAQEIGSAAKEKAMQLSSPASQSTYPDFSQENSGTPARDAPISLHSVCSYDETHDFDVSRFSLLPGEVNQPSASSTPVNIEKNSDRPRVSLREKLKSRWASINRELDEEPIDIGTVRGRGPGTRWPAVVLLGSAGIFCLVCLAIVFFPYQLFLPEIERALSRAIGQPAKVASIDVDIYPVPRLVLGDVRMATEGGETRVRQVFLHPEPSTFLASRIVFSKAVLRSVLLSPEDIAGMQAMFAMLAHADNAYAVRQIALEKTSLSFGDLRLDDLDAGVQTGTEGLLESLTLRSSDRSMTILVKPSTTGLAVSVEAYAWRSAHDSRLLFDSISLTGNFGKEALSIHAMELRLLDGVVQGSARLAKGEKPSVSGEISFERINAVRFGEALGIGKRMSGDMAGKVRFSATADSWPSIFASIHGEGNFGIQRGTISGIDLAEAVRRVSGTPVQGGVTTFEQLTGRVQLTPEKSHFFNVLINSGLMQSTGYVDVAKNNKLNGRFELQMKGSANQTRVPVAIDGTLDSPRVQAMH